MKKLIKFAVVVGAVAVAAKLVAAKKAEWQGLTETEVRDKLNARLPDKVPDDKRAEVADKVVAKMRQKGVLREDEVATPADVGESEPEPAEADPTS